MKPTLDELAEIHGYLAAMIDGEGTVQFSRKPGHDTRSVTISNTDEAIIAHIRYCLDVLEIDYWISERVPFGRKRLYTIGVSSRSGFQKLLQLPIQSSKLDRISEILESYWAVDGSKLGPGMCQCGCGQVAPLAKQTISKLGYVRGQPLRFIVGHNARLEKVNV